MGDPCFLIKMKPTHLLPILGLNQVNPQLARLKSRALKESFRILDFPRKSATFRRSECKPLLAIQFYFVISAPFFESLCLPIIFKVIPTL